MAFVRSIFGESLNVDAAPSGKAQPQALQQHHRRRHLLPPRKFSISA
jgi:hypothetical protein